jgi:hypothetical protein
VRLMMLLFLMVFGSAAAQTSNQRDQEDRARIAKEKSEKEKADAATKAEREKTFFAGWGLGIVNMHNKNALITDATVESGIVRVREEETWTARVLLETHWYSNWTCRWLCTGPFIGAGLSTNSFIDAVVFGVVFGSGPLIGDLKPKYNFGIGTGRRFKVKTLGDAITPNEPLPPGETQVRYKTTDVTAYPVFFFTLQF